MTRWVDIGGVLQTQDGRPRPSLSSEKLTVHADRGSSMTSKAVALLLADLGITRTHSGPHVFNDNPLSEAQLKTRPEFPDRFPSAAAARAFCHPFFTWYHTAGSAAGYAASGYKPGT
jgi:transposase InsO family protein